MRYLWIYKTDGNCLTTEKSLTFGANHLEDFLSHTFVAGKEELTPSENWTGFEISGTNSTTPDFKENISVGLYLYHSTLKR